MNEEQKQSMLDNFAWDSEEESENHQPGFELIESMLECTEASATYILKNLEKKHFSIDNQMKFIIPLNSSIHPLINERWNEEWTMDSRISIIHLFRMLLAQFCQEETYASQLNRRINDVLPPTETSILVVKQVDVSDDPVEMKPESQFERPDDDQKEEISVEITVQKISIIPEQVLQRYVGEDREELILADDAWDSKKLYEEIIKGKIKNPDQKPSSES